MPSSEIGRQKPTRASIPRELIFVSAVLLALAALTHWLCPGLGYTRDPENHKSPTPVYWLCGVVAAVFGAIGVPHVFLRRNRYDLRVGLTCYAGLGSSGLFYLSGINALLALAAAGSIAVALVAYYYPIVTPGRGRSKRGDSSQ